MSAVTSVQDASATLAAAARLGDVDRAADLVLSELDKGRSPSHLVSLLAQVQTDIGQDWERNAITVADEHVATAVVDNALAALRHAAPAPEPHRGALAVVCASGDWHSLPSRMAAALWRWEGWQVISLGSSLPPDQLQQWLAGTAPDALAVTCSLPAELPGLLAVVEAARSTGTPCIAGGRALDENGHRARALGVRWAASPPGLSAALAAGEPDLLDSARAHRTEAAKLAAVCDEVVEGALLRLQRSLPALATYSEVQLASTRADLGHIVGHLGAAVLTDDPSLFSEFLGWLGIVLGSRGVPVGVVPVSLAALLDALPEGLVQARELCAAGSRMPHPRPSTVGSAPDGAVAYET